MKPKFILSKSKALEQYAKVNQVADIVSYSSKTNPLVTNILEQNTNCLFSIHLINELRHVKDKSCVLFLAQAWKKEDIESLFQLGVRKFVVDNECDLDVLLGFLNTEGVSGKINLLLRLKLKERTLRTEKYYVFGMPSEVIKRRINEIKENEKINNKVDQLGVHFHRKTQNMSEWRYQYEIEQELGEVLGLINIVNMGGGLPADYANTNVNVISSIFDRVRELREWLNSKEIKLMIEPGRFIAAPAVKLVTEVIGVYDNTIVVNASVYNSDMDALIVPVKLLVEGELKKGEGKAYVIKGVTPCSMDLFRYRVYLADVKVGSRLVFLNAGAYNFSSEFCDLERIETEVVE